MARAIWDDEDDFEDDEFYERRMRDRERAAEKRNKDKDRQRQIWDWEKNAE